MIVRSVLQISHLHAFSSLLCAIHRVGWNTIQSFHRNKGIRDTWHNVVVHVCSSLAHGRSIAGNEDMVEGIMRMDLNGTMRGS